MQKPMNPSKEKKHMKQISIPLGSPAIAPARSLAGGFAICFVINGIRKYHNNLGRYSNRRCTQAGLQTRPT